MNSQAEVKSSKVGEPLTDNADGNTEPSIAVNAARACVETRQRVCIKCNNVFSRQGNNELHNLEILCRRCHQEHHETRDRLGRYTKV